jgi:hypothetical protein
MRKSRYKKPAIATGLVSFRIDLNMGDARSFRDADPQMPCGLSALP